MLVFFFETWESIQGHFDRFMGLVLDLGIWIVVGFIYAIVGFVIGGLLRRKHHFDSMNQPLIGMLLAIFVALPLTVYGLN